MYILTFIYTYCSRQKLTKIITFNLRGTRRFSVSYQLCSRVKNTHKLQLKIKAKHKIHLQEGKMSQPVLKMPRCGGSWRCGGSLWTTRRTEAKSRCIYCKISWAERETSTEAKQLTQNGSADPPIVRARVLQSTYVLHLQNAFLAFWYLLCQELPFVTTFLSLFKWQCQVLKFV